MCNMGIGFIHLVFFVFLKQEIIDQNSKIKSLNKQWDV